jgi:hypothetical protein
LDCVVGDTPNGRSANRLRQRRWQQSPPPPGPPSASTASTPRAAHRCCCPTRPATHAHRRSARSQHIAAHEPLAGSCLPGPVNHQTPHRAAPTAPASKGANALLTADRTANDGGSRMRLRRLLSTGLTAGVGVEARRVPPPRHTAQRPIRRSRLAQPRTGRYSSTARETRCACGQRQGR